MKPTITHRATITKGAIKLQDKARLEKHLAGLEGREVMITVTKAKDKRSLDQNRYYWKCIIGILSDETGNHPPAVHDSMREMFLKAYDEEKAQDIIRSTTSLNTEEMGEYISNIQNWAAQEYGIVLPDPNEMA